MSKKRAQFEEPDYSDQDVEKIASRRKFKKINTDFSNDILGFCDQCNKLAPIKDVGKYNSIYLCIDCELPRMSSSPTRCKTNTTAEDFIPTIIDSPSKERSRSESVCQACLENQPNQLAHMEFGGCLWVDDSNFHIN